MTLPDIYDLCDFWSDHPPVFELLSMLARCYTTWRPNDKPLTPEQHQASLDARWKAGAMNAAQIYQAMGGPLASEKSVGGDLPGIGPFPDQATANALARKK